MRLLKYGRQFDGPKEAVENLSCRGFAAIWFDGVLGRVVFGEQPAGSNWEELSIRELHEVNHENATH